MSKRDVNLYLEDIKESIEAINRYVKDMSFEEFIEDRKTYSATIREFEIIGEAVGKIMDFLSQDDTIAWRDIKDFRNLLIHEYFGIDFEIVWTTIEDDLPKLSKSVENFLNKL